MLRKIKSFTVLLVVCGVLASATLTSCKRTEGSADDAQEESAEHPAEDTTEHPKGEHEHPAGESEHPKGDSEHPKSDSTDVQ